MISKSKSRIFIFVLISVFLQPQTTISEGNVKELYTYSSNIENQIISGISMLYDRRFDEAESLFSALIAANTDDPEGYFYLAMVTWSRMAAGFWGPEMIDQYGDRIERAISVVKRQINMGRADSYSYFYLGAALGFMGRFRLMQHKWLSSYFISLQAIDALEKCLSMDPDNKDVLFGLGMYDYYTARFSGILKFLSSILLHKGDREAGLEKLHTAAREAKYSQTEAKNFLLYIYLFLEEDFHNALPLAQELAKTFQNEPTHSYNEGITYIRLGNGDGYLTIVKKLLDRSAGEKSPVQAGLWVRRAYYLEAGYWLFNNQYDKARESLEKVLSYADPFNDPKMIAWPLLKIGMSHDLEGKREKAIEYYKKVMDMENSSGAQFLAEKFIIKPPKERDPFLGL